MPADNSYNVGTLCNKEEIKQMNKTGSMRQLIIIVLILTSINLKLKSYQIFSVQTIT
jgi:hypothetical protein